ncbi:quinone oxidoreductase family protein [Sandaracinobacteroides saxicola]|uniref:Quinone oxidoreductase n=1 Tax=Sandaracinobacteroides saxicola TaxID=2759707 RepID=A0A7G5IFQ8_9SPHN|nr:quinone oxidoreductase [Sandaracinobacteroides saxicola]QMW22200.1 quinone oxidoreductase [Sandaracinobacteroides saxicola]
MKAIRFNAPGGPEVLQFVDLSLPDPAPGEARLRHTAIGVNFIDTYHRTGLYPLPLPSGLGLEAAGIVEAIGEGVTDVAVGDRVVYCWGGPAGYATHRNIEARFLVRIPDGVSDEQAAAAFLKACTTEFLVERCARVQPGDVALVQAAAGGVGLLLCQWLKHVGATVIGTVGSDAKIALAKEAGADHVINYSTDAVAPAVRALTGGEGVAVVFDGVGKATWEGSIDSLRRRGLHISYGNASGPIGAVDFGILARKGSLYTTRPTLFDYYATRAELESGAARVFDLMKTGALSVRIDQRYALADAAQAHIDLEARKTTGSSILLP